MLSFWSEKSFQQGQQCAGDGGEKTLIFELQRWQYFINAEALS